MTDTLVTPFGNINLDSLFGNINDANPLNPGDAFTGLQAGDSAIGADAFSIGGTTFDPTLRPEEPRASPRRPTPRCPTAVGPRRRHADHPRHPRSSLAPQDFNVYDGTATTDQIGSITTNEDVTNLLGLTNTEFTVTGATPPGDAPARGSADRRDRSTTSSTSAGIENVYTAIPGVDGAADTVTDTLVTPFGNLDLDSLFGGIDAASALDPGDAFGSGLDVATAALPTAASAIDPLAFLGL